MEDEALVARMRERCWYNVETKQLKTEDAGRLEEEAEQQQDEVAQFA